MKTNAGRSPGLLEDRLGEQLVDLAIGLPVAGVEDRPREDDVAERPEPAVGQAVVIALLLLLGQPDPAQGVAGVLGRDPDAVVGVDRQAVGVPRAVGDPGAAAGEHHRVERRRHPAGGPHALDDVAHVAVNVRLAVGDDDEPLVPQPGVDQLVQSTPVPHIDSPGCCSPPAARRENPRFRKRRRRCFEADTRRRGRRLARSVRLNCHLLTVSSDR